MNNEIQPKKKVSILFNEIRLKMIVKGSKRLSRWIFEKQS